MLSPFVALIVIPAAAIGGFYLYYFWLPRRMRGRRIERDRNRRAARVDRVGRALEEGDDLAAARLILGGLRLDLRRPSDALRERKALARLAGILADHGVEHRIDEALALLDRIARRLNTNDRLVQMAEAEQAASPIDGVLSHVGPGADLLLGPLLDRLRGDPADRARRVGTDPALGSLLEIYSELAERVAEMEDVEG